MNHQKFIPVTLVFSLFCATLAYQNCSGGFQAFAENKSSSVFCGKQSQSSFDPYVDEPYVVGAYIELRSDDGGEVNSVLANGSHKEGALGFVIPMATINTVNQLVQDSGSANYFLTH